MSQELDLLLKHHEEIVAEAEKCAAEKKELSEKSDAHLKMIADDQARVVEIYRAPAVLIKDVDKQFEKATKLSGVDVGFLFVATALQVVRQCLVRFVPPERLSDQEAAKRVKKGVHEKSNRKHHYYRPSLEEIITNPVPFDANLGSNGFLEGSPLGHRGATPGHDPLVGLIVGTANIATSTITNWSWASRHVRTGIYGNMKGQWEIIAKNAVTRKVFSSARDKLLFQGHEGKVIIGASVSKELIHLKSDINTTKSLPLPIISSIDPKLAGELAKRGLDMANAVAHTKYYAQQEGYAILINTIVGMIQGLLYDESSGLSRSHYEVRTRRILSLSNIFADSVNIIGTAATKDVKYLDVGGMLVTIDRIASDSQYIRKIKMKKPDAITEITPENFREKVWPLPASDMIYCGRATTAKLAKYGIHTIGDIANTEPEFFQRLMGVNGLALWRYASGTDNSRVMYKDYEAPIKSIGHGITCVADLVNGEEVWKVILELSQDIGHRFRVHGLTARGVELWVRGNDLMGAQYRGHLPFMTQLPSEIASGAFKLFCERYTWTTKVRAVTVRATNLVSQETPDQLSLFVDTQRLERRERLQNAVEAVRERYGKKALTYAALMGDLKMPCDGRGLVKMPGLMYS